MQRPVVGFHSCATADRAPRGERWQTRLTAGVRIGCLVGRRRYAGSILGEKEEQKKKVHKTVRVAHGPCDQAVWRAGLCASASAEGETHKPDKGVDKVGTRGAERANLDEPVLSGCEAVLAVVGEACGQHRPIVPLQLLGHVARVARGRYVACKPGQREHERYRWGQPPHRHRHRTAAAGRDSDLYSSYGG